MILICHLHGNTYLSRLQRRLQQESERLLEGFCWEAELADDGVAQECSVICEMGLV